MALCLVRQAEKSWGRAAGWRTGLTAEEGHVFRAAVGQGVDAEGPHQGAEAVLGHRLICEGGAALDVVGRPRRHLAHGIPSPVR
jgi:hypothetical protein